MSYYHSKPVDIRGIAKYLMKLDAKERMSILGDFQKLREVLFGKELEQLDPHVSTHGQAWVYAAKSEITSLLFGSSRSRGDFDGIITIKEDGKVCFKEAYEGAFKARFGGAKCMLYEVDPSTFEDGKTSFAGEVVSEKPAKILSKRKVTNIHDELLAAIDRGEFELVTYQKDDPAFVQEMDEHIASRIEKYGVLDNPRGSMFKFCKKKFPEILKRMQNERETGMTGAEAGGPEM